MKKLIMTILLIILLAITCFLIFKNISIAGWTSNNIGDVKNANTKLEEQIEIAKQKNEQEYPQVLGEIEETIRKFKTTKEKYENKIKNISENIELGIVEIKRYKIETLWISLENYAKNRNVELLLNVVQDNSAQDTYKLQIAVVGEYQNIANFLYDIEKDDDLSFRIENFEMHQYREKTTIKESKETVQNNTVEPFESTTTTTTEPTGEDAVGLATDGIIKVDSPEKEETISYDPKWVEATFDINNIEIDNVGGKFN